MPAPGDIDNKYPNKLKSIGITLLQPFRGAKKQHLMQCNACSFEWTATPISKLQNYKKWKKGGCPECTKNNSHIETRNRNIQSITDRGFEILSDYNGSRAINSEGVRTRITVRNIHCNHTFETIAGNLISCNVICPVCNTQRKREAFQQINLDRHDEYVKTASLWDAYQFTVDMATRRSYRKYKNTINPLDLSRGLAGEAGAYHLDHIVPVRYCFDNNIPAEICGHHTNLQMLSWEENITARNHLKENTIIPNIFISFMTP